MRASLDLYDLVHSLTEGEMKAFRYDSGKMGANSKAKYVLLFDAMRKMRRSEYDEQRLKQITGITDRHAFSQAKRDCHKRIIQLLRRVPTNRTAATELYDFPDNIRILINKGLFGQAWKMLEKGRKTAQKLEAFSVHLDLLDIQRELASHFLPPPEYEEVRLKIISERQAVKHARSQYDGLMDVFEVVENAR
ncbi:MAG: hypothetical protein AAF570_22170, partial [Bacteroidota bacterium]